MQISPNTTNWYEMTLLDDFQNQKIIEEEAFYGDTSLEEVVLPQGVEEIGEKAFAGKRIRTIIIGPNVKKIAKKAFKGSKATTLVIKTRRLTRKSVKGCLKGSRIRTVKVRVGSKKSNRKYVRNYKRIFTKKNAGKKIRVK